jgi:pimeloyl-ACP methyl ester carboxylesterase
VLGHRFERLIPVGHSMGSLTAGLSQATYGNADAVVLTGLTGVNVVGISDQPEAVDGMLTMFQPVSKEPLLESKSHRYDEYYYSMPLASRLRMFFHVPAVEREVIDLDLSLQGTQTLGESQTCGMAYDSVIRMPGPVLVEMGEFDAFFMGSETNGFNDANLVRDASRAHAEAIAKAPANFTVADMFKDCGHNLTQHPNAHESYEAMAKWIRELGF